MSSEYKNIINVGPGVISQHEYNDRGKAGKEIQVLATPDSVIADATTAVRIGKGSLCRIAHIAGIAYIGFGAADVAVPAVAVQTALQIPAGVGGYTMVVASGDFIRTSAAMRIEVIPD